MQNHSERNTFLTAPLPVVFARTAAPIIMITTLNGLFAVVDGYFLGAYVGPAALSAVTLIFPGLLMIIALQSLVSNGMASILARQIGAGDGPAARRTFGTAHWLAIAVVVLINLAYWSFGWRIVDAAAEGDMAVAANARSFTGIMVGSSAVAFFLSLNIDALRCEGRIGFMTVVTLAASLLNIAANWFFMAVMQWGVAGSAIGTVSAQAICLVVILTFRYRRTGVLRPAGGGAAGEWRTILALGMPMSLGFIGMSLSSSAIIYNLTLWSRSDYAATIAAYGIITRIMTFAYLPLLGLNIAFQTISGNNFGAGLSDRVGRSLLIAMVSAFVYCALLELIAKLLAARFGAIFVSDAVVIREVRRILPWTVGCYFLFGQMIVLSGYFQSIGDARRAAIFGLSRPYLFTLPLTFLLPHLFGEMGIWMVPVFAELCMFLLACCVLLYLARKRGWRYGLLPV
ncbi:MATE family efflux transporter [Rhizobium mesoamericanum]|uniref:Multidrug export protein MepA n=1 Tax=Rhizobium mesoamericanum STM3625 TaxID=1211777 RepID=K0PU63_9HYPH|nr:MATE family efflux transporter [Rhizobium mesoamericanum]CCM74925.1 putative transmembrane MatE family transporter [Rhizobium mesoamericanum STM3625]